MNSTVKVFDNENVPNGETIQLVTQAAIEQTNEKTFNGLAIEDITPANRKEIKHGFHSRRCVDVQKINVIYRINGKIVKHEYYESVASMSMGYTP